MAQKSDAALLAEKDVIKNETTKNANTALRNGTMLENIINSKINNDKIGEPGGVPELDDEGKIPAAQIPEAAPYPDLTADETIETNGNDLTVTNAAGVGGQLLHYTKDFTLNKAGLLQITPGNTLIGHDEAGALSCINMTANGVDISSKKGMVVPRVTTAERDAIASPVEGIFIYNTDEDLYQGFTNGAWIDVNAGAIGQTAVGIWKFDNVITPAPPTATGKFRLNNATQNLSTELYLNEQTADAKDTANFIAALNIGDIFYIQQKNDATRWIRAKVSAALTDNGTWWTIPITVTASGAALTNNLDTVIRVMFSAPDIALPNASETNAGLVEEATDAETLAGTATGATGAKLFVSPAKLENKRSITETIVTPSAGVITLNCNGRQECNFLTTTQINSALTILITNATNLVSLHFAMPASGTNIPLTWPSTTRMSRYNESTSGDGWNATTKVLTISTVGVDDLFEFSLMKIGGTFKLNYDGPTRA